jgi:hypothetical protein
MSWRIIVLVVLMLFPCVVYAETPTKVTDESKIDEFRLFNLSEDDIESVGVHWRISGYKTLTKNEIHLLITILHKVRKENIEPFKEPSPKGHPSGMALFLKSNEILDLTLNGDYILYGGNKVYLPEIRQFMDQIKPSSANGQIC